MRLLVIVLFFLCLVSCLESGATFGPDPNDYFSNIRPALRHDGNEWQTIDIVFHGHSVPSGAFKPPVIDSPHAYPHLLFHKLKEKYPYAMINIIVTAKPQEDSEQGAKRFERDVLALNPEIVVIDYALNDRRIGLGRAYTAWSSMIEKAQEKGIRVILMTPTPDLRSNINDPEDKLNLHADQIRWLASYYKVCLVDSLQRFKDSHRINKLMSHVNHPNREGHELVARELASLF